MYRPAWFEKIAAGRTLPQMALDVHMTTTGASERAPQDDEADRKCLKHAVENWKPNTHGIGAEFDTCVLNLVVCALAERK